MVDVFLFVCLIIESLAFYAYTKMLFFRKKSFMTTLFCYGFFYLVVFFLHNFNDNVSMSLNIIFFTLANLLILLFCYEVSFISALLHSSFISAISLVSEILTGNIWGFFIKNYWVNWNTEDNLLLMSLSSIFFSVFVILCGILQNRLVPNFSIYPDTIMMIIISICIIAVIAINQFFLLAGEINNVQKCEMFICVSLLTIALFLSIFLFGYMQKLKETHAKDLQQLQLEKDSISFFEEIQARDLNQRLLLHDIKNHLQSILVLNQQSRNSEIDNYIHSILQSNALSSSLRYCKSDLANSIIYRYLNEAEKRNIEFVVDSNNPYLSFIQDFHLTTILCNLLDNAIESASITQHPFVRLTISTDFERYISIISIDNSCSKKIKFTNCIPISTKKDNVYHGLGIKSVIKILKLYNGDITQYQDDDINFHTIVILSWRKDANNNM